MKATAYVCGVERYELGKKTRHKRVVAARRVVTVLARHFTTLSYPEIAELIGKDNHSTTITAHQAAQKRDRLQLAEFEGKTVRDLCDHVCDILGIVRIEGDL